MVHTVVCKALAVRRPECASAYSELITMYALSVDDIRLFAKLTDTELVVIDESTEIRKFEEELEVLDLIAKLK